MKTWVVQIESTNIVLVAGRNMCIGTVRSPPYLTNNEEQKSFSLARRLELTRQWDLTRPECALICVQHDWDPNGECLILLLIGSLGPPLTNLFIKWSLTAGMWKESWLVTLGISQAILVFGWALLVLMPSSRKPGVPSLLFSRNLCFCG